jgi:hypothetical protein
MVFHEGPEKQRVLTGYKQAELNQQTSEVKAGISMP